MLFHKPLLLRQDIRFYSVSLSAFLTVHSNMLFDCRLKLEKFQLG